VSDVFTCGDQFVVAALTEVNDDNYRPLEAVRAELIIAATNNKKAEYIMNQLKDVTSLEAAAELFDTEVKTAENISLVSYRLGAAGIEPAVIGTALALEANTLSAPIKGNNGVYLLTVDAKQVAEGELNTAAEISNLNMRTAYMLPYQALSLIQEKADIVDNRARFQ
jgi:peptidyl-prolyl cis-trans isomerase D